MIIVKECATAAVHALGMDVWEYRRRHPEHGEVFDAVMRTLSLGSMSKVTADTSSPAGGRGHAGAAEAAGDRGDVRGL